MSAYYNEIDPYAVAWLRNLIAAGHIAPGDVDERSIEYVLPADLAGYAQCHFFAGIGVWSYALRRAGWPDDRPVWTGSCPCQSFSAAGKGKGFDDARHLWPVWFDLIAECRPPVILGEQVEAAVNHGWLDLVQADLEGEGYACGAASFPACGVGAPHIRQRLWFVAERLADTAMRGRQQQPDAGSASVFGGEASTEKQMQQPRADGAGISELANAGGVGLEGFGQLGESGSAAKAIQPGRQAAGGSDGATGGLADTHGGDAGAEREQRGGQQRLFAANGGPGELDDLQRDGRREGRHDHGSDDRLVAHAASHLGALDQPEILGQPVRERRDESGSQRATLCGGEIEGRRRPDPADAGEYLRPGPTNGFWRNADWLGYRDGRWRPVEPGTFPLAHGAPSRVGRLRAYGNAICAEAAEAVIAAYLGPVGMMSEIADDTAGGGLFE